jgi:hypothetical protein
MKRLFLLWSVYRDFKSRVIIAKEYLFGTGSVEWDTTL